MDIKNIKNFELDDLTIAKNQKWSRMTSYTVVLCGIFLFGMAVRGVVKRYNERVESKLVAEVEETITNGTEGAR